jgi:hypothetical protein
MWAASRISSTTTPRWTIHGRRRCSVQELARRMVDPPGTLRVLMHSLAFGAGGDYRQCNPGRCYLHQRLRQIPGYEKIMEVARQRNPNRHLTQPEDVARAVSRPGAIRPPIRSLAIRCI